MSQIFCFAFYLAGCLVNRRIWLKFSKYFTDQNIVPLTVIDKWGCFSQIHRLSMPVKGNIRIFYAKIPMPKWTITGILRLQIGHIFSLLDISCNFLGQCFFGLVSCTVACIEFFLKMSYIHKQKGSRCSLWKAK